MPIKCQEMQKLLKMTSRNV